MLWTEFGGERPCYVDALGRLRYGRLRERGGDGEGDLGAVIERRRKGRRKGRRKREGENSIVDWTRNCLLFRVGDGLDGMR